MKALICMSKIVFLSYSITDPLSAIWISIAKRMSPLFVLYRQVPRYAAMQWKWPRHVLRWRSSVQGTYVRVYGGHEVLLLRDLGNNATLSPNLCRTSVRTRLREDTGLASSPTADVSESISVTKGITSIMQVKTRVGGWVNGHPSIVSQTF